MQSRSRLRWMRRSAVGPQRISQARPLPQPRRSRAIGSVMYVTPVPDLGATCRRGSRAALRSKSGSPRREAKAAGNGRPAARGRAVSRRARATRTMREPGETPMAHVFAGCRSVRIPLGSLFSSQVHTVAAVSITGARVGIVTSVRERPSLRTRATHTCGVMAV